MCVCVYVRVRVCDRKSECGVVRGVVIGPWGPVTLREGLVSGLGLLRFVMREEEGACVKRGL